MYARKLFQICTSLFLCIHFYTSTKAQYIHQRLGAEQNFSRYEKTKLSASLTPSVFAQAEKLNNKLTARVDPFIGTARHGHTFPGATLPFGMVQISPDNGIYGWDWCSGYHYSADEIVYFSHKHLSGTGATDLGDIGFMPFSDKHEGRNKFSHNNEYARPGYYAVKMDNEILCEFSATERTAVHRYTFPEGAEKKLVIDLRHNVSINLNKGLHFKRIDEYTIGAVKNSYGWAKHQRCYVAIKFKTPYKTVKNGKGQTVLSFADKGNIIEAYVGLSTVSIENALKNIEAEATGKSFEEIFSKADEAWENELQKINVEADKAVETTFYTSLYHAMIAPALISDVNGEFSDPDGTVKTAKDYQRYSTFSLWDTYRAAHSLFVFMKPEIVDDFVKSMLSHYTFRGALPIWELEANETYCMIGNHSIPVIAEAWRKGIRNFDSAAALTACIRTADQNSRSQHDYIKLGYVPYDKEGESVSKTLEYAYDDWAVAVFADSLGMDTIAERYYKRAQYYKNHFDEGTNLMRPKNSSGQWLQSFDPFVHEQMGVRHYTEGNAWQYTWHVQQDPKGLVSLFKTKDVFEAQLDKLFVSEHELKESQKLVDVTGLIGQYAHGNEPSHHVTYLFNYTNHPEKTQQIVRQICSDFYTDKPDGLIGNEDCGQMSAWYFFSSLGFYPMDPVSGNYELGSPAVKKATWKLPNEKTLIIDAINQSPAAVYVEKAELNGKLIQQNRVTHEELMQGGTLTFYMSDKAGQ
jgi:predicted alpha-1,2-mannosidase